MTPKRLYRVQLEEKKIIGPYTLTELEHLASKEKISKEMLYQSYPGGLWMSGQLIEEIAMIFVTERKTDIRASLISELQEDELERDEGEQNKLDNNEEILEEGDIDGEEQTYSNSFATSPSPFVEMVKNIQRTDQEEKSFVSEPIDAALLLEGGSEDDVGDKTIINHSFDRYPLQKEEKVKITLKKTVAKDIIPIKESVISTTESTECINIQELLPEIRQTANDVEQEFRQKEEELEKDRMLHEKAKIETLLNESQVINKSKNKSLSLIIGLLFLLGLYLFFDTGGEEKKVEKPIYVEFSFPVALEYENPKVAQDELKLGLAELEKRDYLAQIRATKHFIKSLENRFSENPALYHLLLTYANLADQAKDRVKAMQVLFKLTQIARAKALTDPQVALAVAVYYENYNKLGSAILTVEKYLRTKSPTPTLLASYLRMLIKAGELVKAESAASKLRDLPSKNEEIYLSLIEHYNFIDSKDKARELMVEGLKRLPQSIPLLLVYCDRLYYELKFDELERTLHYLKDNGVVRSPKEYSKYLEFVGILTAYKKDIKGAAVKFSEALKYYDSKSLRERLSLLEVGGGDIATNIILESKSSILLRESSNYLLERNYEQAFRKAIEATDIKEDYLPAQIHLAKIEVLRGFFSAAIDRLSKWTKIKQDNPQLIFSLIDAYLKSYRFDEAKQQITIVSTSSFASTYEYAYVLGRYYDMTGNPTLALKWYQEAINKNPLSDESYFAMAKLFLSNKNFKNTQMMLLKAIDLDPQNLEYRALYANILYELNSADTAIGYLRDLLAEYPDDPRLLGEIALYYFRSGELKQFENYRVKIDALPRKDESFYKFLLESAKLEDRSDEIIKYSKELIKLNPGDVDAQMTLAIYMQNIGKLDQAEEIFMQVKSYIPTLPKLHYFLGKIALAKQDLKKGFTWGEAEIAGNPNKEHGYIILGMMYKTSGNILEAIKNYEKAISLNGKSSEALLELADIKAKQNYNETARELYVKVLKEEPGNALAHKSLGLVYRSTGQSILAIESLKTYLELMPEAPDKPLIEQIIKKLQ